MASQHADKWKQAMNQVIGRLKENDLYDLISRSAVPFHHKVIRTRWIYKVRTDFTFKARLVAQGWSRRPGVDYGTTIAPARRSESQRLLMAISTQHDWDIYMLEVKGAFLQSKIDEEVFVKQAPGYEMLEVTLGIPTVM